mgnify:FL=1
MGRRLVVTLIRHGLTKYNEEHRYLGATDIPLSEKGKAQVEKMRAVSFPERFLLFTSDRLRCLETANILFPNLQPLPLKQLREIDFGDWEGKTYEQLKHLDHYIEWLKNPFQLTPPNGEPFSAFSKRVTHAFQTILAQTEKKRLNDVVIITHGGVIRQWLTTYAPLKKNFFAWDVPIGSVITLSGDVSDVRRGSRFSSLQVALTTAKMNG